jgi:hypothetical protein
LSADRPGRGATLLMSQGPLFIGISYHGRSSPRVLVNGRNNYFCNSIQSCCLPGAWLQVLTAQGIIVYMRNMRGRTRHQVSDAQLAQCFVQSILNKLQVYCEVFALLFIFMVISNQQAAMPLLRVQ